MKSVDGVQKKCYFQCWRRGKYLLTCRENFALMQMLIPVNLLDVIHEGSRNELAFIQSDL